MTNEGIWKSLVDFLSGLGGTDPVSMIQETPRYMPTVEEYIRSIKVGEDIADISFYLGVFLGEYINQTYSGYWKHREKESVVVVGPDEDCLFYETSSTQISIEKSDSDTSFEVNPFTLASQYLVATTRIPLSSFVNEYMLSKA